MSNRSITSTLLVLAVVLGIGEFLDAFEVDTPGFAVLFGILFLVGAALVYRGLVTIGAIWIGLLALFEVLNYPMWEKSTAADKIITAAFLIVSLAALIVAVWCLVARRRSARTSADPGPRST